MSYKTSYDTILVDTISELTISNGVIIESVTIENGGILLPNATSSSSGTINFNSTLMNVQSTKNLFWGGGNYSNSGASYNIGIGDNSLLSLGGGDENIGLGSNTLRSLTSGIGNICIGKSSGLDITTQTECILIGYNTGQNVIGSQTIGIGGSVFNLLTNGLRNTAIGHSAGSNITIEDDNSLFGFSAFQEGDSPHNSIFGSNALFYGGSSTGGNSVFGAEAMSGSDVNSSNCSVFGYTAGENASITNSCVFGYRAIGARTGVNSNSGSNLTAMGNSALEDANGCQDTVAIGHRAFNDLTTGDFSVGIGYFAGNGVTTGSRNTFVGYRAGDTTGNGSDNTLIGYGAGSVDVLSGNVFLGTPGVNNDNLTVRIGDNSQQSCYLSGAFLETSALGVTVLVNTSGKMGTTTSSKRYKTNIEDIGDTSFLHNLNVVQFDRIENGDHEVGLIAEQVNEVRPDLVCWDKGQIESVYYRYLPIYILKELQNLRLELDELKKNL
jgi:hypothetical protein